MTVYFAVVADGFLSSLQAIIKRTVVRCWVSGNQMRSETKFIFEQSWVGLVELVWLLWGCRERGYIRKGLRNARRCMDGIIKCCQHVLVDIVLRIVLSERPWLWMVLRRLGTSKCKKEKRSGELRKKLTPGEDRTRNLLMISVEVRRLSH